MTGTTIKTLAAIVVALALAVVVLDRVDHGTSPSQGQALLPDFSSQANDAQHIGVTRKDGDPVALRHESGQWLVESRDSYPADIGKLRQIIGALANAHVVEEKTANPELYTNLAVGDPQAGGNGTTITIDGEGFSHSVIIGKLVQGDRRFARVVGSEQAYLIDQNPDIPTAAKGWLLPDILNIEAKRVRRITIRHADGEFLAIEKSSADLNDFTVLDIPGGRELSYQAVGNGIAGVLSQLTLDDVRLALDGALSTTTTLDTWDGLRITVEVRRDGDTSWLSFSAAPTESPPKAAEEESGAGPTPNGSEDDASSSNEVAQMNARLGGWQYQVSDYKTELLTKHWNDLLKPLED